MARNGADRTRPTHERRRGRRTRRSIAGAVALALLVSIAATGCSKDRPPAPGATTLAVGRVRVHAIVRGPSAAKAKLTVLFLHGQSYTSRIWSDRGVLDDVAAEGFRAVAVDLPGYGETPAIEGSDPSDTADGDPPPVGPSVVWLAALVDELGGAAHVVIVSPSMSGSFSLPYLVIRSTDALAGFVPVAPVGIDGFERPAGAAAVPTLSIWGSMDDTYSQLRAARLIGEMGPPGPARRTEILAGGGHAAYDDHPRAFTALLLGFLRTLEH